EQRIGRLDRYGSGTPITSVALIAQSSKIQRAWYSVLARGLGVFHRSISSLQYLVEERMNYLRDRLVTEGVELLGELEVELGGSGGLVAQELKKIDEQDALDELAPLAADELESLEDVDGNWKTIKASTEQWVVKTLMFAQQNVHESKQGARPP